MPESTNITYGQCQHYIAAVYYCNTNTVAIGVDIYMLIQMVSDIKSMQYSVHSYIIATVCLHHCY